MSELALITRGGRGEDERGDKEVKLIGLISPNLSKDTLVEQEFGKPVVTNTQAWVWEALRGMGLNEPIPGYGCLLGKAMS